MASPRKHDTDLILDAARALALRDGPRAVSVAAIARESGAPVGTLYHRFGNRDGVLSAAWLRALEGFQRYALVAADRSDPLEAAVAMACSQLRFGREWANDARLLLALRRDDLLDADPDERFKARLKEINGPLEQRLLELTRALLRKDDERSRDEIARAVVDLPNAALRRHLREQVSLPDWLELDIASEVRRLLGA